MQKLYEMFANAITGAVLIVCIVALGAILTAFPIKWCWNHTMPDIFGLPEIGFWQAFCLIWLTSIFFKPPQR